MWFLNFLLPSYVDRIINARQRALNIFYEARERLDKATEKAHYYMELNDKEINKLRTEIDEIRTKIDDKLKIESDLHDSISQMQGTTREIEKVIGA